MVGLETDITVLGCSAPHKLREYLEHSQGLTAYKSPLQTYIYRSKCSIFGGACQ